MDDIYNDDLREVAEGLERDNVCLVLSEAYARLNEARARLQAPIEAIRQTSEYQELVKAYYVEVDNLYRAQQAAKTANCHTRGRRRG